MTWILDYDEYEQCPNQGRHCSELFNEIVEVILQLPVRVKEAGTHCSLGNSEDFADIGVLKS
jgi:hypothetical protein